MPSSFQVVSQDWTGKKGALLLVHGIGNSQQGEDQTILNTLEVILGDQINDFAVYQLHYDGINDWFKEKSDFESDIQKAANFFRQNIVNADLADTISEYVGDVIWPILSQSARSALRTAYLRQLQQVVADGLAAGIAARRQNISIVCHSLGCFHTYEALHAAAKFKEHKLQPITNGVRFKNVIFMASPVKLIRSVAGALGKTVSKRWLATLDPAGLVQPSETIDGISIKSIKKTISIVGTLDPVGGYFLNKRADWAFMDLPGQLTIENQQLALGTSLATLKKALDISEPANINLSDARPVFGAKNPHDWSAYINNNGDELRNSLT